MTDHPCPSCGWPQDADRASGLCLVCEASRLLDTPTPPTLLFARGHLIIVLPDEEAACGAG